MIWFAAAADILLYAAAESKRAAQATPVKYGSVNVTFAVEPINALTN
jgi:hypothetical protein